MPIIKTKLINRSTRLIENYDSQTMSDTGTSNNYLTKSEEQLLKEHGYVLKRQIGEGSYAKVFLAKEEGKALACKIVNTKNAPKEFTMKFLPRELDIIRKISHPYIVFVYSILHKTHNYLIFMRYAEEGDLLDYLTVNGALSENVSRIWFHQLSCAIYYLHSLNIAHRDIKCENILISANHNIKLTDFGFARYVADTNGKELLSNTYCGSLAYASPEILRGKPYYPKISDIWSLGVVLFVMLNKAMPFHDGNVKILYKQQMTKRWKFLTKTEAVLSMSAINIVKSLLEPDSRRRLTAEDLLKDIWFTEKGLYLNDECHLALETTSKYKKDMVFTKKSSRMFRTFRKDEKDFVTVGNEAEPREAQSIYFDPKQVDKGNEKKYIGKSLEKEKVDIEQSYTTPTNSKDPKLLEKGQSRGVSDMALTTTTVD